MKKKLLIPLAVFLLIFGVGAAVMLRPRAVPWDECSELYRRYADCPGVEAAYIKDYRVNDTLTLCATVLEATTDTAWAELYNTFMFKKTDEDDSIQAIQKILGTGNDALTLLRRDNQCEYLDSTDIVVASLRDKYICIFHTDDIQQNITLRNTIIDHIFLLVTTEQTLNNHENES